MTPHTSPIDQRTILEEDDFLRMVSLERKRSERSRKPFLLVLLDIGKHMSRDITNRILTSVSKTLRETDTIGWYEGKTVVGIMFTEINMDDRGMILSTMMSRISATLRGTLSPEQFNQINMSFHLFPEDWNNGTTEWDESKFYPDLSMRDDARRHFSVVKRAMDIIGSLLALLFASPAFLVIAVAIKLTSKGPIFFRQQRIGQYGRPFTFLKFRSMKVNNDANIHKEYVKSLIAGSAEKKACEGNGKAVYKLTNDPRVTPIGAFLRRTSLDELPQFLNVLIGEMSLVGPRPPIAYEVEAYDIWHRRRVLEAKPGITGLWQVNGRSRVKFDDMVRLDLEYSRTWSPWMDLKILLRTPGAVFLGEGAH
jgi:exopolysaccharide biosynthesis polyprenyl glycosylphosphotransferase